MRIGELAARSGVSARSLRYYEQHGLLSPRRNRAGHRTYVASDVDRVVEIQELFAAGFCSAGVREVLPGVLDPASGDLTRLSARMQEARIRLQGSCAKWSWSSRCSQGCRNGSDLPLTRM